MKRAWIIILLFVLSSLFLPLSHAQIVGPISGNCNTGNIKPVVQGLPATNTFVGSYPLCIITVYNTGLLTQPTLYTNLALGALSNPFTANADGSWLFFAAVGLGYDVTMSGGTPIAMPATLTIIDVFAGANANQPGTPTTAVQYNCAGSFCGSAGLEWINGTSTLNTINLTASGNETLTGNFTGGGTGTFAGAVNVASLVASGTGTFAGATVNGTLGLGNSLTVASTGAQTGYLNVSSGITTQSSVQLFGGVLTEETNDGYIKLKTNNHNVYIQAGPRTPSTLNADLTLNQPDIAEGGVTTTAGILLGVSGATDATSSGHCMFYSSSSYGVLRDSGFGCNGNIVFPLATSRIQWTSGANNGQLTSNTLTGNRQWGMPDAGGIVNVSLNNSFAVTASKRAVSGCTTGAAAGNACAAPITITWPGAFSNTSYAAGCTPNGLPTNFPSSPYVVTKSAGSMTVNYIAITAAAASWPSLDCWAQQD